MLCFFEFLCIQSGDKELIKVLVAFDADLNSLNFANQTPLDLLKGPQRVVSMSLQDSHAQQARQDFPDSPMEIPVSRKAIHSNAVSKKKPLLTRQSTISQINALVSFPSSITSFCGKGTGIECMSSQKVDKLSGVLLGAGGERRQSMFHSEWASTTKPNAASKCKTTTLWCPDVQCPELQKVRLQYYSMLQKLIDRRLSSTADQLKDVCPDEAASLARHMREVRMLQFAGSRILFLDGGGLRGLMQVDILSQVIHVHDKGSEIYR